MVQLLVLSCSVDSLETEDIAAASSAYFATPLSLSRVGLPARREKSLVLSPRAVTFVSNKNFKTAGCPGSRTCRCAISALHAARLLGVAQQLMCNSEQKHAVSVHGVYEGILAATNLRPTGNSHWTRASLPLWRPVSSGRLPLLGLR